MKREQLAAVLEGIDINHLTGIYGESVSLFAKENGLLYAYRKNEHTLSIHGLLECSIDITEPSWHYLALEEEYAHKVYLSTNEEGEPVASPNQIGFHPALNLLTTFSHKRFQFYQDGKLAGIGILFHYSDLKPFESHYRKLLKVQKLLLNSIKHFNTHYEDSFRQTVNQELTPAVELIQSILLDLHESKEQYINPVSK